MEVAVKGKAKRRHLNAEECDGLGRNAAGTNVLTQPHTSNQRMWNHDPNRGLYPRTPTKRPKFAPATGSPSGRQKGINEFFSVTRVLSSSPHKSPQPSTSKEEPEIAEEEEFDDDDDFSLLAVPLGPEPRVRNEEIDDSLLAAVMMPDPEADEEEEVEEVDDASLLAAEMKTKQEQEVDYLEGVTAEMFGSDDVFEQCDVLNDEEEVEALPDAHYGLLGTNKILLIPQGCMEDLPEELLRDVLSLIPAQDLYRNVSLVCHRWRNIVQDTKFVPFKKQYYRYTMREKHTVREICSVLKTTGIIGPPPKEHSIRKLVVLMCQHKIGERVRPDDVLERVKKHRLFPQAEASITLRIPDIQKHFNLGITGPNPYAAMAVILLLSESVGDVQALVSLLTGCMSRTAITEYLSHMAMMLLALERNKIEISNRLHYNIYYVLHLMENGPFLVSSTQSRFPQLNLTREQQEILGHNIQLHLTREQQQILSHNIQKNHVVKIIAFAGTGKTTTLVKYAEERPYLHFLYVAFNNSVASEARRRFPTNVDCRTIHSLAYNEVGNRYKFSNKLTFKIKPLAISCALPKGRGGFVNAKVVATTLKAFIASADPTITVAHVPSSHVTNMGTRKTIEDDEKLLFVRDAEGIWNKMKDVNAKSKEAYYMTHDGYLKLWQLQNPKPRLSNSYDVLFIDEAQDCTPAIMDLLLSQRCGKIMVGDPHQQIYTFRGAVNALNIAEHTHIYYLTQSFRFGAEIAYVGATILRVCKGVQKILVGGKQKDAVCDYSTDMGLEDVRTGAYRSRGKTAILSRCNVGVFSEAVRLTEASSTCKIHFIGDVKNIGLDRIMDLWGLLLHTTNEFPEEPRTSYIRDPFLRNFTFRSKNAFFALKSYADQTEDSELQAKLTIVERFRKRIPQLVSRLKACSERDLHKADFILGTVHKAKGLEFDTVIISDDFVKVPSSKHNRRRHPDFSFSNFPDDEWNLLYVAVTRAKTTLIITRNIRRIITMAGEYFFKSVMPTFLLNEGELLPCSLGSCPNCITPGSAFIMCRQQLRCTDGVSLGGALCERCVWARVGPIAFLMTDDVLSMAEMPQRMLFRHAVYVELFI